MFDVFSIAHFTVYCSTPFHGPVFSFFEFFFGRFSASSHANAPVIPSFSHHARRFTFLRLRHIARLTQALPPQHIPPTVLYCTCTVLYTFSASTMDYTCMNHTPHIKIRCTFVPRHKRPNLLSPSPDLPSTSLLASTNPPVFISQQLTKSFSHPPLHPHYTEKKNEKTHPATRARAASELFLFVYFLVNYPSCRVAPTHLLPCKSCHLLHSIFGLRMPQLARKQLSKKLSKQIPNKDQNASRKKKKKCLCHPE